MSDNLSECLKKVERYLANAHAIFATEYPAGAITPSYYAFFWLVRGLLYEKSIVTKRHSGSRDMFSLHYIKTGEVPVQFYDDFVLLFDRRQLADYDMEGDFPKEEVERLISLAETFYKFVKEKYA
ncbi:hypothetical protein GCM10023187_28340 [Nibrella viscosa]|uniref:HEPN domain-containing protein n=1 Tax=Nibrella viscosa TaxID=1084524 RepID=A0ABP8KJ46_9BACT